MANEKTGKTKSGSGSPPPSPEGEPPTNEHRQTNQPGGQPKRCCNGLAAVLRRLKNAAPPWDVLAHLGSHPYLRFSPLWIVLVPAIVKSLIFLESKLLHERQLGGIPFSLKLFYFSSVSALCANIVFALKCPTIVRQYTNFVSFRDMGKGSAQLLEEFLLILRQHKPSGHSLAQNLAFVCRKYADAPLDISAIEAISRDPTVAYVVVPSIRIKDKHLADAFWSFRGFAADLSPPSRYICGLLYLAALLLFAIVFFRNAWVVVKFLTSRT